MVPPENGNPWKGPDVELVGDSSADPFEDLFREHSDSSENGETPASVADRRRDDRRVTSAEGAAIARLLADFAVPLRPAARDVEDHSRSQGDERRRTTAPWDADHDAADDSDMLVIDDDVDDAPTVFAVAATDYRRLFSRLRRGGR